MGYLVEWHIPKGKFDVEILDTLPSGLRANVFDIAGCDFNLIYADFGARKIFPQRFDHKYDKLNELYQSLIDAGIEIALNPQVVNLNLWLSNALQDEVISIDSNDDRLDLAVQSKSGSLSRLRFRAEDIEVLYENDVIHIYPQIPELGGAIVDLSMFDSEKFVVHPREKEQTSELHEIAADEIASFLNIKPQVIGLATWDFDEERLRQIFTGKKDEKEVPRDKAEGAAPVVNKQLTTKTRFTLIMLAVVAVSAVNGYREYQKSGHLDPLWYIIVGVTIAVVLVVFAVFAKRRK